MTFAGASLITWGQVKRWLRGGSWNNNQDNARVADRNNNNPNNSNNIGFRVAAHDFRIPTSNAAGGHRRGPRLVSCLDRLTDHAVVRVQKDGVICSWLHGDVQAYTK
ncbi:MAG: hypothetical protein M9928_14260 [Anaerolineae bacterium]|nr:hypothetical protein [Anaerolineae bacterium]MCO5193068.1 hypothetical protein [Anaerolineae bacterium]MCO5206194.1 hypothetical protein [Anaerolineae bacterium]